MAKLPVVSGRVAVRAFARSGWRIARQHGSHVIMEKQGRDEILSVPQHAELKRGTLRSLLRDAKMTVDEFCDLL